MNKILDEVQSRFGAITKEKVIGRGIAVVFYLTIAIFIGWCIYISPDGIRQLIIGLMAAITITYVILRLRKMRKTRRVTIPIPKKDEAPRTYVEKEKPTTAPIPITAERPQQDNTQYVSETRYPPSSKLHKVELSGFAKRRIAQKLPELKGNYPVFEARKSVLELLLQLEKRQPTGDIKNRIGRKDKVREVLEPRSTIYGELLFVLLSLFLLLLPAVQAIFTLPEWMRSRVQQLTTSAVFPLVLVTVSVVLLIWSLLLLYRKWAYWYYWRLILFDADPSHNSQARLVIIDMPFLMPGGTTPSVFLHVVRIATSATFKTKSDQASNRKEQRSFRSILAGSLGISWLIVDTFGDKDEPFNWMGPFRQTQVFETKINLLIAANRPNDR